MADRTLQGAEVGANLVGQGFEEYDRAKRWTALLAEKATEVAAQKEQLAYERNKDAGLSVDELDAFKKSGVLPSRVGAKAQAAGLQGQEKIDAAAAKATADARKGHTPATAEMLKNFPKIAAMGFKEGDLVPERFVSEQSKPPSASAADKLSNDDIDVLKKAALRKNNPLPTSMVTRSGPKAKLLVASLRENPDYNPNLAEFGLAGGKADATKTATEGAGIKVNLDSAHSGFKKVMSKAKEIAARMGQGDVAAFNKAYQYGKREFNSKDAIDLAAQLDLAAGGYARIKKGGTGSLGEGDEASAGKILSTALNRGGLEAIEQAAETEYSGRIEGLPGGNKTPEPSTGDPVHDLIMGNP